MRRNLAVLVGVGGLTGLAFAEMATTADAPREAATIEVNVDVTCPGGAVQMSVDPWVITLNQGDDIDWILSGSAQSSSIEITPKNPGRWPFADATLGGGRGAANAARARNMRENQVGRFQYNITLECQDGDADPLTVVIDPDIIITPGE
jgi:hypothetical protein